MKILVVDDDDLIRELLVEILAAHGYENTSQADCGDDALRVIQAAGEPFDCFMFDIQMPGMDGIELCRHVRNMGIYKSTPVLMITAMNNSEYIDRAFMAGATDYVTKPFHNTELITRIRLADKLQAETRKANEAVATAAVKPKPAFAEPVAIKEIRGFVNSTVLENYVSINAEQKQFPLAAMAIRVPELQQVHAGSDTEEYTYVLTDMAEVLADVFVGSNSFMSYVGSGAFICVGNRNKFPDEENLRSELLTMLNDQELVYCFEVQTSFSVRVGQKATRKMLESRTDMAFLERAIANLQEAEVGTKDAGLKSIFGKAKSSLAA